MRVRRASPGDLPTILRWRREATAWLAKLGSDQWSEDSFTDLFEPWVAQSIARGETWVAEDEDGKPLGTIAIDSDPDPGLWSADELHAAYVIHRMVVDRAATGRGVGSALIDHAERLAQEAGRTKLVLDAWTSNTRLHDYYRSQGFRHVRTVADHVTPSAALFERDVPSQTS